MSEKFSPQEHMMKLKGKDYLEVKWRLVWFREEHPNYGIITTAVEIDDKHALFCAAITDENGRQLSSGYGSESIKDFGDFIEKAETKAVGRALAMLGYGTQFAPELEEGERLADAPVQRTKPAEKPKAPTENMATREQIEWLSENASENQCMYMTEKYGLTLERLSFKQAEKFIDQIKGASA